MPAASSRHSGAVQAEGGAAQQGPGSSMPLLLSASLALAALTALPIASGGYSGAGYLTGLVLLPLALALGWPLLPLRPLLAQAVLLLVLLSACGLPLMLQEGRDLWTSLSALPLGWCAAWLLLSGSPERRGWLLPVLTAAAAFTAAWGLLMWLLSGDPATRLTANFGLPNAYAGFLLLAWPLAGLGLLHAAQPRLRAAYGAAMLALLAAFVLTYSRAGWMVLALQLLAFALLLLTAWARGRRAAAADSGDRAGGQALPAWLAAAILLLLLGLLALPSAREVLARAADFGGYSMTGRLRFWEAALAIWRDNPLLGIGPGGFAYVYPQYQRDPWWYSVDPHSWPLQLLCELGIPGLLLLLAVLAGTVLWLRRIWRALPLLEAGLLSIAVLGSMTHAAVDFDYTFSATTALLGVLLAYGTWRAEQSKGAGELAAGGGSFRGSAPRWAAWASSALLAGVAIWGATFTAERYSLDRLRDTPGLSAAVRQELLLQAVQANPRNHKTHFRLASLYSERMTPENRQLALSRLEDALRLNPRYAPAWALRGLLRGMEERGEEDLARAVELDPWNYPEHWFSWASLTLDEEQRRQRLLDGLEHIQVTAPLTPADIRSDWVRLNGVFARWYYELARLSDDEHQAALLRQLGARFEQADEQRKRDERRRDAGSGGSQVQT